jgi:hypothetical protein
MRGGNNPFVVEVTSNAADACGVVVPTPTWANVIKLVAAKTAESINFFMLLVLKFCYRFF